MYFFINFKPLLLIAVIFLLVLLIFAIWVDSGPTLSASEHQAVVESAKKKLDSYSAGQPLNENEEDDEKKKKEKKKKQIKRVLCYVAGGVLLVAAGFAIYYYLTNGGDNGSDPVVTKHNADIKVLERKVKCLKEQEVNTVKHLEKVNKDLPGLVEKSQALQAEHDAFLDRYPHLHCFKPYDPLAIKRANYAFFFGKYKELNLLRLEIDLVSLKIESCYRTQISYPRTIASTAQKLDEILTDMAIRQQEIEDHMATKEFQSRNKK